MEISSAAVIWPGAFCILICVNSLKKAESVRSLQFRRTPKLEPGQWFKLGAAAVAAVAVVGCKKSREDVALERIANHKPPAYLRFANFGEGPVTPSMGGIPKTDQEPGSVSVFFIRASGKQKTSLSAANKSLYDEALAIAPGDCATLVATSKGAKLYTQSTREGKAPDASINVVMTADDGAVSVLSDGESLFDKVGPAAISDLKTVAGGHHKISVKTSSGKTAEAEADFTAGDVYTVFVANSKAGPIAKITDDSPPRLPVATGASGAG